MDLALFTNTVNDEERAPELGTRGIKADMVLMMLLIEAVKEVMERLL